jgi:DNA repair exonuclease SbcCD ATPase subunit
MKLFHKNRSDEELEQTEETQPQIDPATFVDTQFMTPVDAAKACYKARYGTEMPEEMLALFRHFAKGEIRLMAASYKRLDQRELTKTQEALNLCETRRKNVVQTLNQIDFQQGWYKRFVELTRILNDRKKELYEAQNDYATVLSEIQMMERHDALSPIAITYSRIKHIEDELEQQEQRQNITSEKVDEQEQIHRNTKKQYTDAQETLKSAKRTLEETLQTVCRNSEIKGETDQISREIEELNGQKSRLNDELQEAHKNEMEADTQWNHIQQTRAKADEQIQALESHQRMLENGDALLVKLDYLYQLRLLIDNDQKDADECLKRQTASNNSLNRIFQEDQENESKLQSAKSEMFVHQQGIKGVDGFALQKRTSELKILLQKLNSAQRVWSRISNAYEFINDKKDELSRLQMHFDNEAKSLDALQEDVNKLTAVFQQQNYASTLSKSENVIALRRDLREGSSCSVCGATHHPYHSETEQALNELVNNLKTEAEQTEAELIAKRQLLLQRQLEHEKERTIIEKNKEIIHSEQERLNNDREIWKQYDDIDSSFPDSSDSVNRETRKVMIQQIIERTTQDAEGAQKELDSFNFHQSNINDMVDYIDTLESKKRDNSVRLTEVNTACQVLANKSEQIQQLLSKRKNDYHQLYEELENFISIPGWHNEWIKSNENFKIHIQEMLECWRKNSRLVATANKEEHTVSEVRSMIKENIKRIENKVLLLTQKLESLQETFDDKQAALKRILGENSLDDTLSNVWQQVKDAENESDLVQQKYEASEIARNNYMGQQEEQNNQRMELEKQLVKLRSDMDIWLRKFNASSPPAQPTELKNLFDPSIDWTEKRVRIEQIKKNLTIKQYDVDTARKELTEHQAKVMRPDEKNEDETREALASRKEDLSKQLEELNQEKAKLMARIQDHDRSVELIEMYRKDMARRLQ